MCGGENSRRRNVDPYFRRNREGRIGGRSRRAAMFPVAEACRRLSEEVARLGLPGRDLKDSDRIFQLEAPTADPSSMKRGNIFS